MELAPSNSEHEAPSFEHEALSFKLHRSMLEHEAPSFNVHRSSFNLETLSMKLAPSSSEHEAPSFEHRSEEHTSELQSRQYLVCRLLLEKKKQSSDQ